jgi:outer membrane immunogenic protein
MTSRLIAAAALVLTAGSAFAADLPTRKPAPVLSPVPMAYNWTGFSVGVQAGWMGGGRDRVGHISNILAYPSYTNLGDARASGAFGGFRVGYDWQAAGSPVVAGVAADLNLSGARRSLSGVTPLGLAYSARSKSDWDGSVRARVGYAIDRTLIYVTGGLAVAHNKYRLNSSLPGLSVGLNGGKTYIGGTIGAGVQYAVTNNLAVGLEYRYTAFANKRVSGPIMTAGGVGVGTLNTKVSPDFHRVMATVDYRF